MSPNLYKGQELSGQVRYGKPNTARKILTTHEWSGEMAAAKKNSGLEIFLLHHWQVARQPPTTARWKKFLIVKLGWIFIVLKLGSKLNCPVSLWSVSFSFESSILDPQSWPWKEILAQQQTFESKIFDMIVWFWFRVFSKLVMDSRLRSQKTYSTKAIYFIQVAGLH